MSWGPGDACGLPWEVAWLPPSGCSNLTQVWVGVWFLVQCYSNPRVPKEAPVNLHTCRGQPRPVTGGWQTDKQG